LALQSRINGVTGGGANARSGRDFAPDLRF
jgi:hypothetical protein